MKPTKKTPHAIGVALLVLLTSSCGSKSPAPARSAVAHPSKGGEFTIALGGFDTLDPARAGTLNECFVIQQLFDGLVEFGDDLRILPCLARSWWLSDDRRTYTFSLVENARFHNGRPVEASDVVYSFQRLLDTKVASPAADFLTIIEGASDFQAGTADHVSGLRAPSLREFVVTLKEPYQPFLGLLAMQYTKVLPREAVAHPDFGRRPVGSGAYRFESWVADSMLILVANADYFQGRPLLDRVTLRDIPREQEMREFRGGRLDYLAASPQEFEELSRERRFLLTKRPSLTLTVLGFNMSRAPFDDVLVRRAIEYGLDRAALASAVGGRALPASTILPPGMPGYDPSAAIYRFDRQKAADLLAASGHPGGRDLDELVVFVGRHPEREALLKELVRQLAEMHVRVRAETTDDFGDYLKRAGEADLFVLGWGADFPDPDNFFEPLFRSGARYNFGHYSNPQLDAAISDARHLSDKVERLKQYRLMERRLLDSAVVAPLLHDASLHCMAPSIKNLSVGPMGIYYAPLKRCGRVEE